MTPFGPYLSMGIGARSLFWGLVCGVSVFLSFFVRGVLQQRLGEEREYLVESLHVAGVTILLTPLVYVLTQVLVASGAKLAFATVLLFVFLITVLVTALRRIYRNPGAFARRAGSEQINVSLDPLGLMPADPAPEVAPDADQDQPEAMPITSRLHARLPADISGRILHLSARDHFVDVVLEEALVSLRMRFADAVAELDAIDGHVTHRSHWVASDAIDGVERQNGKIMLRLDNGTLVPVSRTARPNLEAAGLL